MKKGVLLPGTTGITRWLLPGSAALLLVACGPSSPPASPPDTPPSTQSAPETPIDSRQEAAALLQSMATYLAGLDSFSVTLRNGYEVVQASGQKIEFGESRQLSMKRPDRLRVEEVSSDGFRDLALFDGKLMTVFNADAGVYAQAPQPAPVDGALVYFVRDLKMRMPLAQLLSSRLASELPAMVTEVDYVEETEIAGRTAHHIAGRTDSVDFQFWIADGPQPLPQRIVITYRLLPGEPQFWSDFTQWNTSPKFADTTFQLALPKDAQQIPFAVQFSKAGTAEAVPGVAP